MLARLTATAILATTCAAFAAEPRSIGGTWTLNVDKSQWGKRDKPTSAELRIEHNEPSIRYTGTVINANATDSREFKFEGAIDGQPHPALGPEGEGTMTITRVNRSTTKWTFRSNDGKVSEESTTTLSDDGKAITRRIHRKSPQGEFTWTEVYEKVK